jgi:hypothetical protein
VWGWCVVIFGCMRVFQLAEELIVDCLIVVWCWLGAWRALSALILLIFVGPACIGVIWSVSVILLSKEL